LNPSFVSILDHFRGGEKVFTPFSFGLDRRPHPFGSVFHSRVQNCALTLRKEGVEKLGPEDEAADSGDSQVGVAKTCRKNEA